MARRPRNTQQAAATARPSVGTARPVPRENAPRSTFRVAASLRDFALSMPNLVTRGAVNQAAAKLADTPVRSPSVAKAKPVATVSAVSDRKPQDDTTKPETTERRDEPRVCKSRPSRNKGSGNGRPFVPWCK